VTAHEASETASGIDWRALAAMPTLVVLMALTRLDVVCAKLIAAGRDPLTPAILISRGTTAQQRTLRATLATLPDAQQRAMLPPPAILVVGDVAALNDTLAWFDPASMPAHHMFWEDE
jgi:Uroporphyrinogen-III methylase